MSPRSPRNRVFWVACAVVAVLELWLAWSDEIVARPNPYDQLRYLGMAEEIGAGRWLGEFDHLTLLREPFYPLWLAAVDASGVPLRIANELFTIAAALLLGTALIRLKLPAGIAAAIFALLVLQPHGSLVHREVFPSGFYGAMHWVALAGFALGSAPQEGRARWLHVGWTGIALGVLFTTRAEQPLIAAWVAAFAICDYAIRRGRGGTPRKSLAGALWALLLWSSGIALVTGSLAGLNYAHYGVWRTADPAAPGFVAANRALVSIAQDEPRRYVPVPADARRRAYAVSPAFRELRPTLEGPSWARGVSCKISGVCDDIAGGTFLWILREAAAGVAGNSAVALDSALMRVADEIEAACEAGTIECRAPITSFLHAYPQTYLTQLPLSLTAIAARIGSGGRGRDRNPPRDALDLEASVRRTFDVVANRRVELTRYPLDRVRASAEVSSDAVLDVRVDSGGRRSAARPAAAPAPDEGSAPWRFAIAFSVEEPFPRRLARYPVLEFDRQSGAQTRIPLPPPGESAQADGITLSTEIWEKGEAAGELPRRIRSASWVGHAGLIRILTLLGIGAFVTLCRPPWRGRSLDPAAAVIALIGFAVLARVALLTLIDASSFPARSSRYVYPVVSLYSCAMLLLVHRAWIRIRGERGAPAQPSATGSVGDAAE